MNAVAGKQKRKKLITKITIFVFLISMAPLLIMGLPSIISTSDMLYGLTIDSQQERIRQEALYIDLVMNDVESLITNLSGLDDLNNALLLDANGSSYDKLNTQAKIGNILSGYTNLDGLVSIDLFSNSGAHFHVGETLDIADVNTGLRDKLFRETSQSNDFVSWIGIERSMLSQSKHSFVIIAAKGLSATGLDGKSGNGLLVVSYDPAVFDSFCGTHTDQGAYTTILDSHHRIIYHPDPAYIGKTLAGDINKQISLTGQGYFRQTIGGQQMMVVYSHTQKGYWTVAEFIPLVGLFRQINVRVAFLLVLFLFGLLGVLNFIRVISKQVVTPIKKITETFRSLQSGDFSRADKLVLKNNDEIGDLGELFNSFVDAREDITTQQKMERQLNEQNQELQEALSRLKDTQTQMIQQEKLAGIGQLAAGVAHEINNPLGYVIANSSMAGKYFRNMEALLEVVDGIRKKGLAVKDEDIKAACLELDQVWQEKKIDDTLTDIQEIVSDTSEGLARIAKIVMSLKSFSRVSQLEERGSYDINQGIEATLLIANNEFKYNADVQVHPGEVPPFMANGGQINQVLLNILINAVHAIKSRHGNEKGLITIDTYVENGFVCCEIGDNGCGMTEAVINRVFEPFFTTKAVGQGTGLGLSIAYDIVVNKHNGKMEVSSTAGEGSCFQIWLPIETPENAEEETA